ncbi:MAG: hypothetical protein U0136_14405 [Bdellovibrionota bacterium]
MNPLKKHELIGFTLAPLCVSFALLPWFAAPASPLYLGRLIPEARLSAGFVSVAVFIDAAIIGYAITLAFAVPVYILLRSQEMLSVPRLYALALLSGLLGAILVAAFERFPQPLLHNLAHSSIAPLLGLECGLVAATVFLALSRVIACRH